MDTSFDLLLKLLPVVFSALAATGVWYWNYVRERKAELADPASLDAWLPSLADSRRMARYHKGIKRALDRVDRFFGAKAFGWPALVTCLFIAYVYPLVLFMLTWAAGGLHTVGALKLFPFDWHWALRWGFVFGFTGYGLGLFLLVRHVETIYVRLDRELDRLSDRLLQRLPAKSRRLVGSLVLGLFIGGCFYMWRGSLASGIFLAFFVFTVFFPYRVDKDFTGSGASLLAVFFFTFALTFVIAFMGAIAIAGAGVVALIVASGIGLIAIWLLVTSWEGVGPTSLIMITVLIISAPTLSPDVDLTGISMLIFLLILPLLNGLLDYVSWGVSRSLGRRLLKHFDRYTAIALAFVDAVCAVLLLGALAVVLCTAVELLNALALAKTGAEALDLGVLLAEAAADPFGSGFWITAMLFSTLIPTLFHLGIAVASAVLVRSRSKDREVWVEKIENAGVGEQPFSEVERGRIARYLFFHRALGPLVLTLILVVVFIWGWSALVGDISNTLLALAEWSRGWVHGG